MPRVGERFQAENDQLVKKHSGLIAKHLKKREFKTKFLD